MIAFQQHYRYFKYINNYCQYETTTDCSCCTA